MNSRRWISFFHGLQPFEFLLKTISRLLSTRAEISRLSGRPGRTTIRNVRSVVECTSPDVVVGGTDNGCRECRECLPPRATRLGTRGVSRATILSSSSLLPFSSRIASSTNFSPPLSQICLIYIFHIYIYSIYIYIINYKNITCIRDARREYFDGFVVFRRPKKLSDPAGYRNFLNDTGYTNVGAFSLTFVIFLNIERQPGIHHPFDNRKKPNETFQQLLPLFLLVPI